MTVQSQMPELDRGDPPSYKLGSQNTPYKQGLMKNSVNVKNFRNLGFESCDLKIFDVKSW